MTKLQIAFFVIVGLGVIGFSLSQYSNVTTVENQAVEQSEVNTEPVEVIPEWMTDEDAVKAAEAVMQQKKLQAELAELEASFASSTAEFEALKDTYTEEKIRLQKELSFQ